VDALGDSECYFVSTSQQPFLSRQKYPPPW
jgi:hypothetical protein